MNDNITYPKHPLLAEKISRLRGVTTTSSEFRTALEEVGIILFLEATKNIATKEVTVTTPLQKTQGIVLNQEIVLVPVLRAGLGFLNGVSRIIGPDYVVGMIGIARNEKTLKPNIYLNKLPENLEHAHVFLLEPMLATGGSSNAAVDLLRQHKAKRITILCAIAAPEGVRVVMEHDPNLELVIGALDSGLNEHGFILPGLGDAGDRYFDS
jgi:uracil phosphoribosyltransferase